MKKFIPVFCLLLIALGFCVAGDAITVPPWWMIGQSATENGAATFTVPITTTGKTTTGTLESGAATFTSAIQINDPSGVARIVDVRGSPSGVAGLGGARQAHLWGNCWYDGSAWVKLRAASASALLSVDGTNKNMAFYTSDDGSSNVYQNGPYTVWHGGMSTFQVGAVDALFSLGTSDGSDNKKLELWAGSANSITRGAGVSLFGNEYGSSVNGTAIIYAGADASASIRLNTGGSNRVIVYHGGDTDVVALAGSGNRAVYSDPSGTLTNSTSDGTLKTDVQLIVGALDKIRALRGVTYRWIDTDNRGSQREMGMIAQEVQPVVPEVIGQNSDGKLSLDYPKLTALLIEAMKQQQAQIEDLKSRIETLEGK